MRRFPHPQPRHRDRVHSVASCVRGERRGGVLVLFVMLIFGFMALAALVVDLGLASSAQGQMQGAVDMAALEAMRWRNVTPPPNSQPDFNEPIPFLTEDHRRQRVRELVRMHFDEDLDPDGGDAEAYQVGPSLSMQGGGRVPKSAEIHRSVQLDSTRGESITSNVNTSFAARGSTCVGIPATRASPDVGSIKFRNRLIVVVLPAPLPPSIA